MFEGEGIPKGLAEMPPGPQLAAVLVSIDRDRISGYERVILMKARARLRAWVESDFYADLQSVTEAEQEIFGQPDEAMEAAAGEIRAALTLTRRGADFQMGVAYLLRDRLPDVWTALHRGSIDLAKARVICNETVSPPHRRRETGRRDGAGTCPPADDRPVGSPHPETGHQSRSRHGKGPL